MVVLSRSFWAAMATMVALVLPATALAQTRTVDIASVPQGATVRLDSETANPLGTTPLRRVRIRSGSHTLFFTRDGFIPGSIQINVTRSRETFTGTLVQGGSIYVSADVDGAQIFLDGNAVGTTPGRINNVQPGQHVVEIRQTGMQTFRDTVTVGAGAVASVNATLRPPPPQAPPTGIVRVIVSNPNGPVPADLQVTFDGSPMTGQPPSNEAAQPGTHIVQISANGFRSIRREVAVTAGQTYALAIDLDAIQVAPTGGTVRVIVPTTGAQVFLDGELLPAANGAPAARENVPAGQHSLRITATGRQTVTRDITVSAGQTTAIEIPDLAVVAQIGRLTVRSSTPNVTVFIDGRNMGPSPYTREDMPAGNYNVTLRAQGFDDRNESCTVSTTQACDVNVPLTRSMGHATLHVELSRQVPGAVVLIDNNAIGEVGAGRDIPNVTAENHEIRVRAEGYVDYVESVTFQENEQHRTIVSLRRSRRGPSGAELATRRSAISTWGASPLSRGDAAVDIFLTGGAYPLAVRGTIGILQWGLVGIDGGIGIRTFFAQNQIDLRARAGVRVADGLLSLGIEARPFLTLGAPAGFTGGGFATALAVSLHSLALTSDQDADASDDPNESANRLGSFAFTLRAGLEYTSDSLQGMSLDSGYLGGGTFTRPTPPSMTLQPVPGLAADPMAPAGMNGLTIDMSRHVISGVQSMVRGVVALTAEIGLARHWNLVLNLDAIIGDRGTDPAPAMPMATPPTMANPGMQGVRRALFQALYNGTDLLFYPSLGLTYKF